jgi:hypothetical protein
VVVYNRDRENELEKVEVNVNELVNVIEAKTVVDGLGEDDNVCRQDAVFVGELKSVSVIVAVGLNK